MKPKRIIPPKPDLRDRKSLEDLVSMRVIKVRRG